MPAVDRLSREAPLPREMQGRWVDAEDSSSKLIVNGGEVTCFGRLVEYNYKEIVEQDGAVTVSLGTNDSANEDTFQRENITGLVMTPEGQFHAYNVKFAAQFVPAGS